MALREGHQRRSIRLRDYDYAGDGAYFVTICTHDRVCLFGEVVGDAVQLNDLGEIVRQEWLQTAVVRPYVTLDEFVVMPNHFHAILFIAKPDGDPKQADGGDVGAQRAAPLQPHVPTGSLGAIVRGFKSAATKRINDRRGTPGAHVWQRSYYEHVVRNESALNDIQSYVQTNPARWADDAENPVNVS